MTNDEATQSPNGVGLALDGIAQAGRALAHPGRLLTLVTVIESGGAGIPVSDVANTLSQSTGIVSRYLHTLGRAGLIRQQRVGSTILCFATTHALSTAIRQIVGHCCSGHSKADTPFTFP